MNKLYSGIARPLNKVMRMRNTNLGRMYANGRGVEQDDEQAVFWYRKAAEQGHASAQFNLGWMYDERTRRRARRRTSCVLVSQGR